MFPKIAITIERDGGVYDFEIKDPPIKKQFVGERSLAEYLSTRFTMSVDEAFAHLQQIGPQDGRRAVLVLPILPENIALL